MQHHLLNVRLARDCLSHLRSNKHTYYRGAIDVGHDLFNGFVLVGSVNTASTICPIGMLVILESYRE